MEIKKVLNLSEEEFAKLVAAGDILGSIRKALEAGEADELSNGVTGLLVALKDVLGKIK